MRERLGEVLRVGASAGSVMGKTNEGMGWIGRGEGLAVHAVALIDSIGGVDATWGAADEGLPF